jgi:hypothetical protein
LTVAVVVGFGLVEREMEESGRTTERRERSWREVK